MTSADVTVGADGIARCWWCGDDPDYVAYHDEEWGVPLRDERALFELLCLEGFQAGLSWLTILRKRDALPRRLRGLRPRHRGPVRRARGGAAPADEGIVRHRGKITATIGNAAAVEAMRDAGTSLVQVVWSHAPLPRAAAPREPGGHPRRDPGLGGAREQRGEHGLRFVGPTTVYAFMQSAGLVDDHLAGCHRSGIGADRRRGSLRE